MQYKRVNGELHPEFERAEQHLQLQILGGVFDDYVPVIDVVKHARDHGVDDGAVYDVMAEYVRSNLRIFEIPASSRHIRLSEAAKGIVQTIFEAP